MPPSFTNSAVSYAKHSLSYPIYAADFDPYNRGYLVVAGGGGEGRSGVPNQISVLDVSKRSSIETVLEVDLSRDEDSVQSLANLATKDGLICLAGINSSQKAQNAGNNEHFRSFGIRYPARKRPRTEDSSTVEQGDVGGIELLGKRALFKPSAAAKKETYQRLLRLSPVQKSDTPGKRIGAIASGFATESEIVVFNATTAVPSDQDIIAKIDLPKSSEAGDLDIAHADSDEFSIAYCDEHNIYEQTIKYDFEQKKAQKRPNCPRRVHQMPSLDSYQEPKRQPKFRCLRYLTSENLIAVVNKPNKGGAELRLYHLYPTGPALEMQTQSLPSHIKQVSSLDVRALDADDHGNQQFVLAVAGQDISIEILTLNYKAATDTFSPLRSYMALRNVHDQQMTRICWAPFHSPTRASTPTPTTGGNDEKSPNRMLQHTGPQYIRLASVSYGNTVVIDTFPLTLLEPNDQDSRYVLSHPNDEVFWRWAYIIVISFIVLVTAFLFQSFTSAGFSGKDVGPFSYVPERIRNFLDKSAVAAHHDWKVSKVTDAVAETPTSNLKDVLTKHHDTPADAAVTAVVVSDDSQGAGIDVAVHHDKEEYLSRNPEVKHWSELEPHQKKYWKQKLINAGQWAEHEGEDIMQGVLWSFGGQVLREL